MNRSFQFAKRLATYLLILIFSQTIIAQTWEFTNENAESLGYQIHQTTDGGVITAGYIVSNGAKEVYVVKLNSEGEMEWENTLSGNQNEETRAIALTNDGGYLVLSFSGNLTKLDNNGSEIWNRNYEDDFGTIACQDIVELNDGNFLMIVNSDTKSLLVKIDNAGGILWTQEHALENQQFTILEVGVQTSDNGFILTGRSHNSTNSLNAVVVKTDLMGEILWSEIYPNEWGIAITELPNQEYAFTSFNRIVKIDKEGELIWVKKLSTNGVLSGIWNKQNNNLIFGGSDSFTGDNVILIETDSDGNLIWSKLFGTDNPERMAHTQPSNDNGAILVGGTNCSFTDDSCNLYALKIDSTGSGGEDVDIEITDTEIFTNLEPTINSSDTDPVVFPNPITDIVQIDFNVDRGSFKKLVLSDMKGQLVLEKENFFSNSMSIDLSSKRIPNGIYILSIYTDNRVTNHKIVIER